MLGRTGALSLLHLRLLSFGNKVCLERVGHLSQMRLEATSAPSFLFQTGIVLRRGVGFPVSRPGLPIIWTDIHV